MPRIPFDPATDYYRLLDVAPNASSEEIQAAYRRLAKAYHPDLNAGSTVAAARMARLNVAKSVLLDPVVRADYDKLRRARTLRGAAVQRVVARARPAPPARPIQPVEEVGSGAGSWPYSARPSYGEPRVRVIRPPVGRPGPYSAVVVHGRSRAVDRGTGILLLIALPLIGALLVYVVQAVQVAGKPLRAGPADLALVPMARPTPRGTAEAAFLMVQGQPPSRSLGQRAYNLVLSRSDASPEGELVRAAARQLLRAGGDADGAAWDEAVTELCLLANRCTAVAP